MFFCSVVGLLQAKIREQKKRRHEEIRMLKVINLKLKKEELLNKKPSIRLESRVNFTVLYSRRDLNPHGQMPTGF